MNMPRTASVMKAKAGNDQWQSTVRSRLSGRFDAVARLVSQREIGGALEFDLLKYTRASMSLEVRSSGRRAYLKLFDLERPDLSYRREKAALMALRDSGLVPRMLAYSDGPRFILCEWASKGLGVQERTPMGPADFAYRMGYWLAEMDGAVPGETACGNWYVYLQKFGAALETDRLALARDMLSEIPLCGRAMSRNDAALASFMTNAEGHLMGCDFDRAQMRPRGWDYVLGYIGLTERFPDQVEEVLDAYAKGFAKAHRGALIVEELNVIARILYRARSNSEQGGAEIIRWQ